MTDTMKKVLFTQAKMIELYLDEADNRPWVVSWSGGKDSTCVLKMVTDMLLSIPEEKRKRHIYVLSSDTLVENPNIEKYLHEQVKQLRTWSEANNMPMTVQICTREDKYGYFYYLLGRGITMPGNGPMRWCTGKLKIDPMVKVMRGLDASYCLVGSRLEESSARSTSIKKYQDETDFDSESNYMFGTHNIVKNLKTFMPIVHFTTEEVWYLLTKGVAWGSTVPVRTLYKEATGECGFSNPKGVQRKAVEVCGARFGCWTCPVVQEDRSTEKMAETHAWMEPLTEWRKLHIVAYGRYMPTRKEGQSRAERSSELRMYRLINEKVTRMTKSGHRRKNNNEEIESGQGILTLETRKFLLEELLATEKLVNRMRELERLEPIKLIHDSELELIYETWKTEDEVHYTNKDGIKFNPDYLYNPESILTEDEKPLKQNKLF